jgi:type I restriction enzyme S subunit
MSHLSFMEKLLEGVEVEWKALGEVGEVRMCKRILKNQTSHEGEIPFYKIGTFGKEPDAYIPQKLFEEFKAKYNFPKLGEVLISASGTIGRTVIFDGRDAYFQDSNIVWVENNESRVLNKYLFYFYQIAKWGVAEGGTIQRLYNENLRKLQIPIPPLNIQAEIVRILDAFTAHTAELTAELTARKKQYNYYRDQLLTFEDGEVEWKSLVEVAKIKHGKDWKKLGSGNVPVYGSGGIMTYVDTYSYDKPTVLIPRKGSITNIFYIEQPFWNVDTIYYTEIDDTKIIPKFFYYYMKTINLLELDTGAGRPSLTQAILNKIEIPIPPLTEQARIVAILDKFDALTNSISEGLPREIALRQQQYEYYREKLLNFKCYDKNSSAK